MSKYNNLQSAHFKISLFLLYHEMFEPLYHAMYASLETQLAQSTF